MADSRYAVDYAKRNAKCQKCKQPVEKGSVRLAKIVPNIFSDDSGDMKQYHHASCLFESFKRTKATTKIIEEPGDIEGWDAVKDEDKEPILELIRAHEKFVAAKSPGKAKKASSPVKKAVVKASSPNKAAEPIVKRPEPKGDPKHRDNSFREYRRLVANIAEISSYLSKTELVKDFFTKGSDKAKFNGDLHVWIRLLLPGVVKRIYNLQSKQLVKIFSRIFGAKESAMLTDLEQGDVAETIATFFEESEAFVPNKKATLTVHDVDAFLDSLTSLTKEEEQSSVLSSMASKCTSNDLKMIVRLIKGDLRMQAGAKHILDALHK
jgi:DNA ligase-3